jgi:Tol biopolymer transport system component
MGILTRRRRTGVVIAAVASLAWLGVVSSPPQAGAHPDSEFDGQLLFTRYDAALDDQVPFTVNPDGSHPRQIYPYATECPHWSPNGTEIASCGVPLGNGEGTTILNVDSGQARYLPFLRGLSFSPCYVWSPDARRLACEGGDDDHPSRNGIYTVRVSDWSDIRRVTSNVGGDDVPGSYSPGGHRLTYASYTGDEGEPLGLFVVPANGVRPTRLTPAGSDVASPGDWSPAGNEIVFSRHLTDGVRQTLWMVHANGHGLHQIDVPISPPCGGSVDDPHSLGCSNPVWSPSGRKLAFSVNKADGSDLYILDLCTDRIHLLAKDSDTVDWGVHPLAREREDSRQ